MKRRWTQSDIDMLPAGMVKGGKQPSIAPPPVPVNRGFTTKTLSDEKKELNLMIYGICKNGNTALVTEHRFSKRRYKFDWALPEYKIAIEYEGLMSKKSGHTTITGYTDNCTKYNLALKYGWKVLRYTVKNYKNAGTDLLELIEQK